MSRKQLEGLMSNKYHISDNGEPGKCNAQPGRCPKKNADGSLQEHYDTPEEASQAQEEKMKSRVLQSHSKKDKHDRKLAGEHFDQTQKKIYGNISEDHLDAQRKQYINDVMANDKARAEIRELNALTGQKTPYDEDFDPKLDNAQKTATKIEHVANDLSLIAEDSYKRDEADKATILKTSTIIKDNLRHCDFSTQENAEESFAHLEDLKETLNNQGHQADASGNTSSAVAYWRASESLSDALNHDEFRN